MGAGRYLISGVIVACACALASAPGYAQSADGGGLALPPPPPPDPGPAEAPAVVVLPEGATSGGAGWRVSQGAAPAEPSRPAPGPVRPRGAGAARTLSRLRAVIADQASADQTSRRVLGAGYLVGGGVTAVLSAVPLSLPALSTTARALNVVSALSMVTTGAAVGLTGALTLLFLSPWEEMDNELRADVTTDPSIQLAQALARWSTRAERERSASRLGGGLLIATGVLFVATGALGLATVSSGNVGASAIGFGLGAVCIPAGIANFYTLTPSERALRAFRLSQGHRALSFSGAGARVGLAPSATGLSLVGTF
jgi:hypothetical protein